MRRAYRSPRITKYGTMKDLTRGASGSITDTSADQGDGDAIDAVAPTDIQLAFDVDATDADTLDDVFILMDPDLPDTNAADPISLQITGTASINLPDGAFQLTQHTTLSADLDSGIDAVDTGDPVVVLVNDLPDPIADPITVTFDVQDLQPVTDTIIDGSS